MEVDGSRMALAVNPGHADLADQPLGLFLEDREPFSGAADVHQAVGIQAVGEPFPPRGALQKLAVGDELVQERSVILHRDDRLVRPQGNLRAGADQVFGDHHGIVRVHHGAFEPPSEKILGVVHEILVQGVGLGDQGDQGFPVGPAHPASPLPGGGHRSRVAHQDAHIQPADIDPQFQGAGGDDPQELPGNQLGLDLPPFLRKEAGPVRAHPAPQVRPVLQHPGMEQFGDLAGLGEGERAEAGVDAVQEEFGRQGVGAGIRVQEKKVPSRPGRSALRSRPRKEGRSVSRRKPAGWRWWPSRR